MTSSNTKNDQRQHHHQEQVVIVYAILGSQYVFKVLAAMQGNAIPHYVHLVPMKESERRKVIPSGGLLVPELQVGLRKDEHRKIVPDSEAILEYLFHQGWAPHLYPNELSKEVSKRASSGTLAAMVWYYNWVDETGYRRSMRRQIGTKASPWFVPYFVLDYMVQGVRTKHEQRVLSVLPNADLADEPAMRQVLKTELEYFERLLETGDQPFLIPGTTEPSAADFSTYCLLERLVGDVENDPSSDYPIFPAVPEIKTKNELFGLNGRLWKWHDRMRTNYKVQFKGHRVPKELLSKL